MYFDHISPLWLLLDPPHLPTHPSLFSLSKNRKTHQTSWTNKRPVRQNITRQSKTVHKKSRGVVGPALEFGWYTQWHSVGENGFFFSLCQLVSTAHSFKVHFPLLVLELVCLEPVQVLCAAVSLYVFTSALLCLEDTVCLESPIPAGSSSLSTSV